LLTIFADAELRETMKTHSKILPNHITNPVAILFYNSVLPMWILDARKQKFIDVNNAALHVFGYNYNQFLSQTPTHIFCTPHNLPAGGTTTNGSYIAYKRKHNGDICKILVEEKPVDWNTQQACLCQITIIDNITPPQPGGDFESSLIDNICDIVVAVDKNQRIILWNKAAEHFYGYMKADVYGFYFDDVIKYEYRSIPVEAAHKILKEQGTCKEESLHKNNQGLKRWLSSTASIIYNNSKQPIGTVTISRDITQTKKTQQRLEENEARFRFLSEHSQDLICLHEPDGTFIYLSPAVYKLAGYTQDELLGKIPADFIHEEDLLKIITNAKLTLKGNTNLKTEYRFRHKNGHYVWFETVANPLVNTQTNRTLKIQTNTREITERKVAEIILSQKEHDYRTLTENLPVIVHRFDSQKRFTYSNKAYEVAFNKKATEIYGKTLEQVQIPCSVIKVFDTLINKVFKTGKTVTETILLPRIDGSNSFFLTTLAAEKKEDNAVVSVICISKDITDIKRAEISLLQKEKELITSNERFSLAAKASNDAIWDWDINSNQLYWGEGFYNLFGYNNGLINNRAQLWQTNIHDEDRSRVVKGLEDFIASGTKKLWVDEYRFKKKDGSYALVNDRGYLIINNQGKPVRMVGAIEDITEKKLLEKKLLRKEINKQKAIAQAVVNTQENERAEIGKELHDNVNQVLSTAKLFLDVAKTNEAERMELMKKSSGYIVAAINEIRNISRSLIPPAIKDLGLCASLKDIAETISSTRALQVELIVGCDVDNLLDEKQQLMLFRIIQEQLTNILKHAQASLVQVTATKENNYIHVEVADNGKGFKLEEIKNKKGTGLSNIISRAQLFNGTAVINAAPGKGCKIKITIPVNNLNHL
jgi:PAS domain S-box-containing protein